MIDIYINMYVELDKQIYFNIFFQTKKCFKVEVYYYFIILLLEKRIAQNLPLYQNTEKLGIYSKSIYAKKKICKINGNTQEAFFGYQNLNKVLFKKKIFLLPPLFMFRCQRFKSTLK